MLVEPLPCPTLTGVLQVVPPFVECCILAPVCALPSMGLWIHEKATVVSALLITAPLTGVISVGAAGAMMVTTASEVADHAETSVLRVFLTR